MASPNKLFTIYFGTEMIVLGGNGYLAAIMKMAARAFQGNLFYMVLHLNNVV